MQMPTIMRLCNQSAALICLSPGVFNNSPISSYKHSRYTSYEVSFYKTNRTIHKWASIILVIPLLLSLITGILLLVKKEFSYIQRQTVKGQSDIPTIPFAKVLNVAKSVSSANISDWKDIDRLDVRPNKGVIKIRSDNSTEIQIDATSGDILNIAHRRSDFIESLHDTTHFQDNANLWLMLPIAIGSLLLLFTGL